MRPNSFSHTPQFNQPDYGQIASPTYTDFGSTPPEPVCYSPVDANTLYSASTPELVSSDSISTMDSRSSISTSGDNGLNGNPHMQYVNQPYMHLGYQPQPENGAAPLVDPNQWTPGIDKMALLANQWLDFSPQTTEPFYYNVMDPQQGHR